MNYVKSKDTKVYALGTFDGIHRGHQRVIRKAVEEAASVNGVSIIITFEHHPLTILHQNVFRRGLFKKRLWIPFLMI